MVQTHKNLFAADKKTFECDICYNECEISTIAILQKCGHYFCKNCLQDYYKYMVNISGQIQKIKCPNANCKSEIENSDLKDLLNSDTYEKFKRLLLNYEVGKSKDKKFCPYPGCEAIIHCENANQKKITCGNCHKDVCFQCQIPWHQGQSCKQAMNKIYAGWAASFGAH